MNQKLTPPSPERQALVTEWARQVNSGEYHAGYWNWMVKWDAESLVYHYSGPAFHVNADYRYEPSPRHPHFSIFLEWEAHKKSGAVERGEYELRLVNSDHRNVSNWQPTSTPRWEVVNSYELRKTDKHPDNCKPKLKLIDCANVPVGTMTDLGVVFGVNQGLKYETALVVDFDNYLIRDIRVANLHIIPATSWTAVQDNEKPPVCAGLVIEYRCVGYGGLTIETNPNGEFCIAYRVIGIAEGYTDVPEEEV